MKKVNLEEYMQGVCPMFSDLDSKEEREFEKEFQKEGVSLYTTFIDSKVEGQIVTNRYRCTCCAPAGETSVIHEVKIPVETDYVYIGSGVANDNCGMVTAVTCRALIIQLRNTFGNEPEGARLFAKNESDGYKEVVCQYDTRYPKSIAYAFMLEGNLPAEWSPAAKRFIDAVKTVNYNF